MTTEDDAPLVARESSALFGRTVAPLLPLLEVHASLTASFLQAQNTASVTMGEFFDSIGDGSIDPDPGVAILESWLDQLDQTFDNLEGRANRGGGPRQRCLDRIHQLIMDGVAELALVLADELNGKITHAIALARRRAIRDRVARGTSQSWRCFWMPEPLSPVAQSGGGGDPPISP